MTRLRNPLAASAPPVDLAQENSILRDALDAARHTQAELRKVVDQITAPPWYPCLLLRRVATEGGPRALVSIGGAPRLVTLHPRVAAEPLAAGDPVYLDAQQRTVVARADGAFAPPTETARFVRTAADGRLVVRVRDDELLLDRAARLDGSEPRPGDSVLFERAARLALEYMPGAAGRQYLLEDVSDLPLAAIGGSRACLDELVAVLSAALVAPERARRYGLGGRRAVLLYGPPGCGKTLAARTAAAELARRTGKRCRFAVVRPGEFESPYVGESEANIRACFEALAAESAGGLALVFLDEIEAIGRIRGAPGSRHADRFLAALLAEIDGFRTRGEVAILAATNRRDLLDPALRSRLSDVEIAVPRPGARSAREIFGVHLPESLPYAAPRGELLDAAVARLYAPNAENEVARLTLRDGSRRTVRARELASGRLIEQICLATRERAFRREARGEGEGIRVADAADAVADALGRLATLLSVHNARAYLDDLPDDLDVVGVEPIRARPERRHRYRHAS
jgi:proteasome regulatory subunit